MNVDVVPIATLTPHPRNPRRGNVNAIAESITRFGQFKPLTVQRSTGHVLAGNHTLAALRGLGHDTVPVIYLDVDDDTALAILLADNRTSDLGGYDEKELARILNDARNALDGTGYDDAYVREITRTSGLLAETMSATFATAADAAKDHVREHIAPDVQAERDRVGFAAEGISTDPTSGVAYNPHVGEDTGMVQFIVIVTDTQRDTIAHLLQERRRDLNLNSLGDALYSALTELAEQTAA